MFGSEIFNIVPLVTAFGKICCSYGISTTTCDELHRWIKSGAVSEQVREIDVPEFFHLLLRTFDGDLVNPLKTELPSGKVDLLLSEYARAGSPLFTHEGRDVAVTCLAMTDWIKGMPTIEIERKYSLCRGSLYEVARQLSRLTRACRDIARKTLGGLAADLYAIEHLTCHMIPLALSKQSSPTVIPNSFM